MSFSFILFLRKITSTNVTYENYVPWYDRFAQVVIEGKALPTKHEWYPGGLQISLHIDLPDF